MKAAPILLRRATGNSRSALYSHNSACRLVQAHHTANPIDGGSRTASDARGLDSDGRIRHGAIHHTATISLTVGQLRVREVNSCFKKRSCVAELIHGPRTIKVYDTAHLAHIHQGGKRLRLNQRCPLTGTSMSLTLAESESSCTSSNVSSHVLAAYRKPPY
eukprot:scaffold389_cov382-Prasinococcus_capsulatus_cf.AAC.5